MSTEIVHVEATLGDMGVIRDEEELREYMSRLRYVKDVLEAADMFRKESVRFAQYEAYALIRAVEIAGNADLVKGKYRKMAAEWLCGLSDDERQEAIGLCVDGKTIDNVFKETVYNPRQRLELSSAIKSCKEEAQSELKDKGIVIIPNVVRKYQNKFPRSMVRDITNGVREAVRGSGGVGLGDSNGTYVDPDRESYRVKCAITTRIDAIVRDMESVVDLVDRCRSKPVFTICSDGDELGFTDITYLIMAGVGCVNVKFDNGKSRKCAIKILRQVVGDIS